MRIPTGLIPPVIVVCFFAVVAVGLTWELPTMQHDFSAAAPAAGEEAEVQMIVDGLRCRGTSNFFVAKLQRLPGVLGSEPPCPSGVWRRFLFIPIMLFAPRRFFANMDFSRFMGTQRAIEQRNAL